MARTSTHKEQNSTRNSTRSASTTSSTSRSTPQQKATGQVSTAQGDRERPIASGREGGRDRGVAVRQRGSAPVARSGSPISAMRRMAEDMDHLFEQFGFARGGLGLTPRFGSIGSLLDDDLWSGRDTSALNMIWTPEVEAFRRGNDIVIRADIPGVNRDDVHVHVENDVLTISGERREEHEENREGFYRSELSYGQFYRAIPLPEGANADRCEASFRDGVLEVTIPAPKLQERKAKRIQVK